MRSFSSPPYIARPAASAVAGRLRPCRNKNQFHTPHENYIPAAQELSHGMLRLFIRNQPA
jgi:hypothetical protein